MNANAQLESARNELEKILMQIGDGNQDTDREYLAGYIDCLGDKGHVSEAEREILYAEYAL